MTTYLGKSCSFCLPRVPFVNCRQFMYLVISLLVLRAGYGIWLYQFLIIAYLFTSHINNGSFQFVDHSEARTFRTEWTHPRLHCSIQVALSLSAESATFLQQCPRLNTVLPYYTLKKKWIPELQVISDAYAHYKSVISGKPKSITYLFFFFFFFWRM